MNPGALSAGAAHRPSRREATAALARDNILAAAADCVISQGVAKVTMSSIAHAAGVSSSLLHYHFATKARLFAALLSWTEMHSRRITQGDLPPETEDHGAVLAAFLDQLLPSNELRRREWLLWTELDTISLHDQQFAEVQRGLYQGYYERVAHILRAGIDSGEFRLDVAEVSTVAEAVVALTDGVGARLLTAGGTDLSLARARQLIAQAVGRLAACARPLPLPGSGAA